jgi:hypothetical protein
MQSTNLRVKHLIQKYLFFLGGFEMSEETGWTRYEQQLTRLRLRLRREETRRTRDEQQLTPTQTVEKPAITQSL